MTLEANGRIAGSIAGSAVTLFECVNNFRRVTSRTIVEALACVTSHSAQMLSEDRRKGALTRNMDADLIILDTGHDG